MDQLKKNVAKDERPFLPELAWAYYRAYTSVLYGNFIIFKMLESGIDEPFKYIKKDASKELLKAVLPHQSNWIDANEPQRYHLLLDEIEESLLKELRKILEGVDASAADIERARGILQAVNKVDQQQAEARVDLQEHETGH